jgi:hypothetical protein
MLRAAHKQLSAAKLADLLSSCPLVLVYQSLGSVRSSDVSASVQNLLDKQLPGSGLRASCLQVKNSVARSSASADISRFLQANSLLLGWQVPEARVLQHIHASQDTDVAQILQLSHPGSQPHRLTGQQLRQQTLATLIDMGIRLPDALPVALLASFYQGQQVSNYSNIAHPTWQAGVLTAGALGRLCCCLR